MTGSGNDFVVFDGREVSADLVTRPEVIRSICSRHNGIGADGLVLLESATTREAAGDAADEGAADGGAGSIRLRYFNRDGTLGELCGNATLCSTALAVERGLAPAARVSLLTDAGSVRARVAGAEPEIDIAPVTQVNPQLELESGLGAAATQVGYARVGVPHVVMVLPDLAALEQVDPIADGRPIRQAASLRPDGANVNWVAPTGDGRWAYRTYERGVEDETLACGTGAIAAAILLTTWGLAAGEVTLVTRSGRPVAVRLARSAGDAGAPARWQPSLRGEGRVVFRGTIAHLPIEP
jgi:diaminopimelate epimerase